VHEISAGLFSADCFTHNRKSLDVTESEQTVRGGHRDHESFLRDTPWFQNSLSGTCGYEEVAGLFGKAELGGTSAGYYAGTCALVDELVIDD